MVVPKVENSVKIPIEESEKNDHDGKIILTQNGVWFWFTKEQCQALKDYFEAQEKFAGRLRKFAIFWMCFGFVGLIASSSGLIYSVAQLAHRPPGLDLKQETGVKKVDHHQDGPKEAPKGWNAMQVGFISHDAIIETGATVEPGAFIFPKAVIKSGAVGKIQVFSTLVSLLNCTKYNQKSFLHYQIFLRLLDFQNVKNSVATYSEM